MANEIEQNNFSFGIQDTSEMGMGSQDLLDDLLSPETATTDVEKLKDINEEVVDKPAPSEGNAPIKKEEVVKDSSLEDFLLSNEIDDNDGEEEEETLKPTPKAKKEEEEDDGDDGSENPSGTNKSKFESLTNDLFELGVFNKEEGAEDEEPITTGEKFLERFNSEKKKGAIEMVDNFIGQFGKEFQDAFDSIFVNGVNPKEYFEAANKLSNFSELDLTVESNQERVVREVLTEQGYEGEDLDSEIERLKNYGDLESVSQRHHKVLIKKEQADLAQKTNDAKAHHAQKAIVRQEYYDNVNNVLQEKLKTKEFDGIPLNPKTANELQDFLLVDKWKTDSGETLTDFDRYILELKKPENHQTKVKVGLLLKLLEKDPTLSTIQKTGITKKTDELFKEVSRQVSKGSNLPKTGKAASSTGSASWFSSK